MGGCLLRPSTVSKRLNLSDQLRPENRTLTSDKRRSAKFLARKTLTVVLSQIILRVAPIRIG
jgi:hypothetical protein